MVIKFPDQAQGLDFLGFKRRGSGFFAAGWCLSLGRVPPSPPGMLMCTVWYFPYGRVGKRWWLIVTGRCPSANERKPRSTSGSLPWPIWFGEDDDVVLGLRANLHMAA